MTLFIALWKFRKLKKVILPLLRKVSHIDKMSLSLKPKESLTPPAGLAGKAPEVRELFVQWVRENFCVVCRNNMIVEEMYINITECDC